MVNQQSPFVSHQHYILFPNSMGSILQKTYTLSQSIRVMKISQFPLITLLNFQMSLLDMNLLFLHLQFNKTACLVCAAQLSQELVIQFSALQASEGLVSKVLSLPPNPALCKQTDTVYCRRSLVSDEGNKVLLTWPHGTEQNCYKAFLNGSSCFVCTVPHLLLSILFSSVVFIYSWLFLNLQS